MHSYHSVHLSTLSASFDTHKLKHRLVASQVQLLSLVLSQNLHGTSVTVCRELRYRCTMHSWPEMLLCMAQVMSGEEGLQGSWFTGTITQLQHGFALVAYDELHVSEDSDEKLQEWYPLPDAVAENKALLESTHDAHFGPQFRIRPPPPAEVGCIHCMQLGLPIWLQCQVVSLATQNVSFVTISSLCRQHWQP